MTRDSSNPAGEVSGKPGANGEAARKPVSGEAARLPANAKPASARPAKPRKAKPADTTVERRRGGQARAISDLMPEIGRTAFRRFGFVQSSVVTRWAEIVGESHARVSCPEAIRFPPGERSEGILQLVVEGAHAALITHLVPEIMARVNRFFGYKAVGRVKIRQGSVHPRESMGKAAQSGNQPPMLRPVPIELGDSLRDIGDPELRAVLESLARSLGAPPAASQIPLLPAAAQNPARPARAASEEQD